jgi:hypothetical protein
MKELQRESRMKLDELTVRYEQSVMRLKNFKQHYSFILVRSSLELAQNLSKNCQDSIKGDARVSKNPCEGC